jgi:hypothetical protein
MQVAVFDTGLVVEGDGSDYPDAPDPGEPLPPPTFPDRLARRVPNPWAEVGRALRTLLRTGGLEPEVARHVEAAALAAEAGVGPEMGGGLAFSLLGSLLVLKGHAEVAPRYFHAWDRITCPVCGSSFVFADRWWGFTR